MIKITVFRKYFLIKLKRFNKSKSEVNADGINIYSDKRMNGIRKK